MDEFVSSCNCCDQDQPPGIAFYFAFRTKTIKGAFCGGPGEWILSNYHSLVAPQTITPSNPPNPTTGELHSDITVSYAKTTYEEVEPAENICFDTIEGGYYTTTAQFNYVRSTNPLLRMVFRDTSGTFYNREILDANGDPTGGIEKVYDEDCVSPVCCSTECGSPLNPFLTGSSLQIFESLSKQTSSGGGGCGADYFNFCGTCDPDDEESGWPDCYGPGTTPITLDIFDKETYTTTTKKGCRIYPPRPGTTYPSGSYDTTGTYERIQETEANCCFAFVCLSTVQSNPGGTNTDTTQEEYNLADFPPIDEYTTAQLGQPTLIEDVIAETEAQFAGSPYVSTNPELFGYDIGDVMLTTQGIYPSSPVNSSRTLQSEPFSAYGFSNFAELDLSAMEYRIAFAESPGTCYVKLWFDEEFMPYPLPEDWPINPITWRPQPQVTGSFSIEHEFATTQNKTCFVEPAERGSLEEPTKFILHPTTLYLDAPSTAGTKIVRLRKYSYVKDYEPNDPYIVNNSAGDYYEYSQGCKPNGFPLNPETETCGPELEPPPGP